ncbi:hypothetical protein [Leptolyngbya iicbica]|uniref:Uncharacterized protein n=1 Tax=Lyngbya confervoides BDU141951 TaxID=1574623 RepID=A0A8T6QUV0_9CYAN|nr:hypothetical protein [Leptolyngbya sp. LK]
MSHAVSDRSLHRRNREPSGRDGKEPATRRSVLQPQWPFSDRCLSA